MNRNLLNQTANIREWVDNLNPALQVWLKDYLDSKLNKSSSLGGKIYYIIDYKYADNFIPTAEQIEELGDLDTEIMFIYDTINHTPIHIRSISGSPRANEIAKNQAFWTELTKGYAASQKGNYNIKSIIGPKSAGFLVYGPPNQEYDIIKILSQSDKLMGRVETITHTTIAKQNVIHMFVDSVNL
jgi:hypothetical protein